jgi:cephalosporin-C deacetylase
VTSTLEKPAGFDAYWREVIDELASYPMRPEIERVSMRSTDFAEMYGVRLTSIGPYRIFAYLSIPVGDGPFPAMFYTAKYGSVVEPVPQGAANLNRSRFITCSVSARGQRNSNQPFAADFPGMLTEGIVDKNEYVFRGVAADCLRALEFLLERPEIDRSRVVAVGNDMALITASLGEGITHVVTTPALFFDTSDLAPNTTAYPLQEVNDFQRLDPDSAPSVSETLSYFNTRWFAPGVESKVLLSTDSAGGLLDRETLRPLIHALPGEVTVHESLNSSYKDGLFTEEWIAAQCGFDRAIVPEHWR